MNAIIIEDTFRPELYANSIPATAIHAETKSGTPAWVKWVIGLVGVGLFLTVVLPRFIEWLESHQRIMPEDKTDDK